jgi:primary-amine oxidase
MSHRKVLEISDREVIPRSSASMDIFDPAVRGYREGLKPIVTTQPQGANFTLHNHAVSWDRWRFRYSMNPREGLVLHQVGWEESPGKVRSILYRASLSDILVPYADPDADWSWRAYFDESDFGFGNYAMPLVRGVTSPAHATLLSEPMPDFDGTGGVREAQNLVDIYERDAGVALGTRGYAV